MTNVDIEDQVRVPTFKKSIWGSIWGVTNVDIEARVRVPRA